MSRRKKKKSRAGLVVFLLLFVVLALLLALRAFDVITVSSPDPTPTPYEEHLDSGVIIRPLQSPELDEDELPSVPTASPVPTPQAVEEPQGAVILEQHGELEILVPEDMDSDGF